MSALTRFRDHCRRMAGATREDPVNVLGEGRCWPTDDERRLWVQLADEVDAYLTGHLEDDDTPQPVHVDQDGFDFGGSR